MATEYYLKYRRKGREGYLAAAVSYNNPKSEHKVTQYIASDIKDGLMFWERRWVEKFLKDELNFFKPEDFEIVAHQNYRYDWD